MNHKKLIFGISLLIVTSSACTNNSIQNQQAALKRKDSLLADSIKQFKAADAAKVAERKEAIENRHHSSAPAYTTRPQNGQGSVGTYGDNPPVEKKKGWSDAAKGSAIGAGGGAIAGALIDKRHGQGAIIGGLVGAGAGYLIGRGDDRKSGRVKRKVRTDTVN